MQADEHLKGTAPALSEALDHPPLPNVIIVPPAEERQATPPWAYFDAQAQAQENALSRRVEVGDVDASVGRRSQHSDDFHASTEVGGAGRGMRIADEDLEEIVDPYLENVKTRRQLSYEGTSSRGTEASIPEAEAGPSVFPSVERDYLGGESFELVQPPNIMSTDNLNTALTKPRKNSFSSLFRRSNVQNIDSSALSRNTRSFLRLGKPTITPKRSFDRPSPARASTVDPIVGRRFSFFELRRRFSTSSLASNQSSSSLAASSTLMSPVTPSDLPPILPMPSIVDEPDSPMSTFSGEKARMDTSGSRGPSRVIPDRRVVNSKKGSAAPSSPTSSSSFLAPLQFESFDLVSEVFS